MLRSGEIIGGMYQIIREIGKGGTGVIYLGYHLRLRKQIVIKKIKDNCAGRINVRAEADILKRLHHTYLPQVYDFLAVGTGVYTVMDYIPGYDLQHYLDNGSRFPEKTLLLWLHQLCQVLSYLHSQSPPILHSDIKPANIMITPQGNVCLIDFNISLDGEETTQLQGLSQYYAAPEQYENAMSIIHGRGSRRALDGRMDIYSLSAVFYKMMTGLYPSPDRGVPYPIMNLEVPYSEGLKSIINKGMEKEPGQRFQTAGQMEKALSRIEKMDPRYRLLGRLQALLWVLYGLTAAGSILLIYAGFGIWQNDHWQKAYSSFYEAVQSQDETEIVTRGTEMLNDFMMQGYLDSHPGEKAEVLHALGDSYYRQEQYEAAAEYYEDALDEDEDNALYLRDYLAGMARAGQYVDTLAAASEYPEAALGESETMFVEAQIACAGEDWEQALDKLEQALAQNPDEELSARIYSLEADVYTSLGDPAAAADAAVQAASADPGSAMLRKAGQTCFDAGNAQSQDLLKRNYYERALGYYKTLCAAQSPSYEDQLNHALVLRALGRYQDSLYQLEQMKAQYPDDYVVLMWMCFNYLDQSAVEGTYGEVSADLSFCYNSCRTAYMNQDTENENMETLIEIMDELE